MAKQVDLNDLYRFAHLAEDEVTFLLDAHKGDGELCKHLSIIQEQVDGIKELISDAESTVHILHNGRAICGFSAGTVPGEWPLEHRWTSFDREWRKHCTCPSCRLEAERAGG